VAELGYADAFGRYGAKLKSVQWAVSAVAEDELVVSCWKHYFQSAMGGALPYEDNLSRWSGPGNELLKEHLEQAIRDDMPVRLVMAQTDDKEAVASGAAVSSVKKSYSIRKDLVSHVTEFDGDHFRIEFRRESADH
jgi:putative restriction endonuclease